MTRKARRATIIALVNIAILLPLLEIGLRLFDPWGINRYYADWTVLYRAMEKRDIVDYTQQPGEYRFADWTATELSDYTRLLPDGGDGPCSLVFIGDSVTWGHGVDDHLTFANRLAVHFPDVTTRNAAYSGYDSRQVRDLMLLYPADIYVYLVISNDPYARQQPFVLDQGIAAGSLRRYIMYIAGVYSSPPIYDWSRFWRDMDAMAADGRVVFTAFDDAFGRHIARYYPVHLIPYYHTVNSRIDGHPDDAGHAEIAAALLPVVKDAVYKVCVAVI